MEIYWLQFSFASNFTGSYAPLALIPPRLACDYGGRVALIALPGIPEREVPRGVWSHTWAFFLSDLPLWSYYNRIKFRVHHPKDTGA